MLPKNNKRGKEALKRLRVYIGVPSELSGREMVSFKDASSERLAGKYIELGVIARELGWRVES
ncbi:MAG: 50S ribosomal protein L13, partial [Desulfurococcales archaeon]|nr:50S ribosomal protein L13 [Desulfurococcales archaeon]